MTFLTPIYTYMYAVADDIQNAYGRRD